MARNLKSARPHKPNRLLVWVMAILAMTWVVYQPLFSPDKDFTNWDDNLYVLEQPLIQSLEMENIRRIFHPQTAVAYNYHPLTLVSLAIDYQFAYDELMGELRVAPFARTNLLLHLLNTVLVFFFIYQLSRKRIGAAILTALFFGIHPMHVESVAWISERKDLLYGFFFLASCLAYLLYIELKEKKFLALSFLLFIGSLLSKAMAVPLPFVLLITDLLYRRRDYRKLLIEKVPFLVLSLILGIHTLTLQEGAINTEEGWFSLPERLLFAAHAFVLYLVKLLIPYPLSPFYPYPPSIPGYLVLMPLVVLGILLSPLLLRKTNPQRALEMAWGIGFYTLMIIPVLKVISVGGSMMADRYSYIAYIGPFFVGALYLHDLIEKPRYRIATLVLISAFGFYAAAASSKQIAVWHNSRSLWTHTINHYPIEKVGIGVKTAYKNLGDYYATEQQFDSALHYYELLDAYQVPDAEIYGNLGNLYAIGKEIPSAVSAFSKAIAMAPDQPDYYLRRSIVLSESGSYADANHDLDQVIALAPDQVEAYKLKAKNLLRASEFRESVEFCHQALQAFPDQADLWFYKGIALISLENYHAAIQDLKEALSRRPDPMFAYNLAIAYSKIGSKAEALNWALRSKEEGFPVPDVFISSLQH